MSTEVTCALISLGGAFLGVLAGMPLINYRIQQLEKKVDKHNSVIERTYRLEARMDVLESEVNHERQTN